MAAVTGVVAHFGIYGAIAEAALAAAIGGGFVWIWWRERQRSHDPDRPVAEMNDDAYEERDGATNPP